MKGILLYTKALSDFYVSFSTVSYNISQPVIFFCLFLTSPICNSYLGLSILMIIHSVLLTIDSSSFGYFFTFSWRVFFKYILWIILIFSPNNKKQKSQHCLYCRALLPEKLNHFLLIKTKILFHDGILFGIFFFTVTKETNYV